MAIVCLGLTDGILSIEGKQLEIKKGAILTLPINERVASFFSKNLKVLGPENQIKVRVTAKKKAIIDTGYLKVNLNKDQEAQIVFANISLLQRALASGAIALVDESIKISTEEEKTKDAKQNNQKEGNERDNKGKEKEQK